MTSSSERAETGEPGEPGVPGTQGPDRAPARRTPVREPGRAAAFSDAVVAVAMTALVLPLFNININTANNARDLWATYGDEFSAFFLSFFIIAIFWMVHHKIWFLVRSVTSLLLWVNMLWLLGILLIPFASIAVYENDRFPALGYQLYAAVVFYVSATLGVLIYLIYNRPELHIAGLTPLPLWYAMRFAGWWLIVLVACVVDARGVGVLLLEWSGIPMFILGAWRPASVRHDDAALSST